MLRYLTNVKLFGGAAVILTLALSADPASAKTFKKETYFQHALYPVYSHARCMNCQVESTPRQGRITRAACRHPVYPATMPANPAVPLQTGGPRQRLRLWA